MSYLQRFLKNGKRDGHRSSAPSSFRDLTEDQLEAHLSVSRYGRFTLTDAVRPSYDLQVVPRTGYRHDTFTDKDSGVKIPVLMASASREILFDLFVELLDPLGEELDVVLETSHEKAGEGHKDLYRENIDLPVLKSTLYDFESAILDDGCLGIACLNPSVPVEVQFDEHKLLIVYGQDLTPFESVLTEYGIVMNDDIKFITEAEHVHSSTDELFKDFEQLAYHLGVEA
ncbi:hypothetical protein [Calycomorphotria hydatis]|uniref:Uncharacterized protein n=1 Tax=Calycomorphotria hydatis TaxID=2528027 RepID=A0A517T4X8_9PLAN|nr:hypothetical protein [Calycomorphotria hydatis]QDT63424.1 hypothetical protein V22_06450 [Calycomorphotria hydatis]